jgi:DNA repair exonuclease SbcCD ATPase subunit
MKIKSGEIENFKNIKHAEIQVDGRSFVIAGNNAAGKSSEIQALLGVLTGKGLPAAIIPVDAGDKDISKVKVVVESNNEEYTVYASWAKHPVTGKIKGEIDIKNKEGNKIGIKAFRDMIGDVSFDIFSGFLQKKKQDQIDLLKVISGAKKELDILDMERKERYTERTGVNHLITEYEGKLKNKEIGETIKVIPTDEIYSKMNAIEEDLKKWMHVESGLNTRKEEIERIGQQIHSDIDQIKQLEEKIAELKENIKASESKIQTFTSEIKKGSEWLSKVPKPSMELLQEELKQAHQHNEKAEEQKLLIAQHAELVKHKTKSIELTEAIQAIDDKKAKVLSNSQLPVEGLTFDDEGLYLNGVPLEEGSINTAKLWEVGIRIMVAMNNKLKVCRMDMNVMDKETFATIVALAEQNDMQVIFEKVNWEPSNQGPVVHFVEEYL